MWWMRRGGRSCWFEAGNVGRRTYNRSSSIAPLLLLLAWLLLARGVETAVAMGMQQHSGRLAAAVVARGWQRHRGGGVFSFVPLAPSLRRQQHEQQQRQQHRPPPPLRPLDRPLSTTTASISSAATSTTAPGPSSAEPMEPTARERANMAVASYFPLDTKDNATAFFHVSSNTPPPLSWAQAVAAALGLPLERAQKLHEVGAVYARRGGKFRRTRTFSAGGVDEGRFIPAVPVEGEIVRVHLFPRWVYVTWVGWLCWLGLRDR